MKDFYFSFTKVVIIQLICVFIIVLSLFAAKFFWKKSFIGIKKFYATEILSETNADEVLKEETGNGI